jgi:hypothetical protein
MFNSSGGWKPLGWLSVVLTELVVSCLLNADTAEPAVAAQSRRRDIV